MGILEGKKILVAGVLTEQSIAFSVARIAQEQGATVVLSNFGRALSLCQRIAKRLPQEAAVVELDVTNTEHLGTLADRLREHVDSLDGVVHSIGFAPQEAMGDGFTEVAWEHAATAFQVSTWSMASLTQACRPLFGERASVVGLTFDATVPWPVYGWMGAAKAALESTSRYLARELGPEGVRVNLVAAGPLRTMAMKSIPGSVQFEEAWEGRAPLGWSVTDTEPAGKAVVALLSDWFPATTGEIVHVDGGFHAVGVGAASVRPLRENNHRAPRHRRHHARRPAPRRGALARCPQQRGRRAVRRSGSCRTTGGAAGALLRRPRGARRRDAVPGERHPGPGHPARAARGSGG